VLGTACVLNVKLDRSIALAVDLLLLATDTNNNTNPCCSFR
jgi:hypothetical protein